MKLTKNILRKIIRESLQKEQELIDKIFKLLFTDGHASQAMHLADSLQIDLIPLILESIFDVEWEWDWTIDKFKFSVAISDGDYKQYTVFFPAGLWSNDLPPSANYIPPFESLKEALEDLTVVSRQLEYYVGPIDGKKLYERRLPLKIIKDKRFISYLSSLLIKAYCEKNICEE
jgi:hypothetical protein